MTKLYRTGNNTTEIENDKARILYSYNTAVAAYIYGRGYIKTATHYSTTTSKHINQFIPNFKVVETVPQSEIDALIN